MQKCKFMIIGILISFLFACGHVGTPYVKEVKPPEPKAKRAVILPFPVYGSSFTPYTTWRKNTVLTGAFRDHLSKKGWAVVPEANVIAFLFDQGVIIGSDSPIEFSEGQIVAANELSGKWGGEMKSHLEKTLLQNIANQKIEMEESDLHPAALDKEMVRYIGQHFGVDYVIRGRLTEYSLGQETTYYPRQEGRIHFFFNYDRRIFQGFSQTNTYELYGQGVYGENLDTIFGDDSGAVAGDMVHRRGIGEVKALGHLTVIVHNASTGEIVSMKRAYFQTLSTYSMPYWLDDYDDLYEKGIRSAVKKVVGKL